MRLYKKLTDDTFEKTDKFISFTHDEWSIIHSGNHVTRREVVSFEAVTAESKVVTYHPVKEPPTLFYSNGYVVGVYINEEKFSPELINKAIEQLDQNITEEDIEDREENRKFWYDLYNKKLTPEREE